MKRGLEILSLYNRGVNEKIAGILGAIPEAQLKKDMGAYYKSIGDTFYHMTMADVNWLGRLKNVFPHSSLSKSSLLQTQVDVLKAKIEKEYMKIFSIRKEVDALYEAFVRELKEEDLEKIVNYKNKRGEDLSKKAGHILMHLFNHQTHHRGEISAMLDIQKVSNDYAGLLNYL